MYTYIRPVLVLALLAAACGDARKETPVPAPTATPAPPICKANAAWITSPNPPSEVPAAETFCDFYQFSWQWFLAQVSPADPAKPDGDRVFEATNRVASPSGGTNQCAKNALSGRAAEVKALSIRDIKPDGFEDTQADGFPLYDQSGNVLYYSMWYSPEECQATAAGFVPGTLEIKVAWRILASADPTYFTIKAAVPVVDAKGGKTLKNVTLGLVGFHLVNWTPKHPEMIWATFEHKANVPLCSGQSQAPASGWSFTSSAAAACLASNPSPNGQLPAACASFDLNHAAPTPTPPAVIPSTGTPDEVCQLFKYGTDSGKAVNGNDNAANALAIEQLNHALVGPGGLLTSLTPDNPMAVWANYQMIGGLWTKNGQASGAPPPVPSKQGTPNPNSPQRGSLELANVTMETYEQGSGSFVPNCFGCHNYKPATPLTVSHIALKYLLPPQPTPTPTASPKP
jgi:hypothetical protein